MSAAADRRCDLESEEIRNIDEFRRHHSTAVLVIMFTDLKDSTRFAETQGEVLAQAIRMEHDAMLRTIIERDGAGRCIKRIGDSLMCIFAEPTAAVQRALEIQQRLDEYNRDHRETPICVRIGMHLGQVVVENDVQTDVFGRHVNRAARVESLAHGGQILLSLPVYDSASGWLDSDDVCWRDHGEYLLKGIAEPTRIYEVYLPGKRPRLPSGKRRYNRALLRWAVVCVSVLVGITAVTKIQGWFNPDTPPSRPVTPPLMEPTSEPLTSFRVSLEGTVLRQSRRRKGDPYRLNVREIENWETQDKFQLSGSVIDAPVNTSVSILKCDTQGDVHVVATFEQSAGAEFSYPANDGWLTLEQLRTTRMFLFVATNRPVDAHKWATEFGDVSLLLPELRFHDVFMDERKLEFVAPQLQDPRLKLVKGVIDARVSERRFEIEQLCKMIREKTEHFTALVFRLDEYR